jgi:hypothetical protein
MSVKPEDQQNNQMISVTALGYWSTEDQVYSVTGMNSIIVQKMTKIAAADVTTLIQGYIKVSDQRIRHKMGLPYTIRKEFHVFHFNEQYRDFGPAEDEYEFFDYYDPTDRVEKVFAIYSNKKRLKYPFPKNCDDLTEDTTIVSPETAIDNKQWATDDINTWLINGSLTPVSSPKKNPVDLPSGIGFYSQIPVPLNSSSPTTTIQKDTTNFMAGKASLKAVVTNSNGGMIYFPSTKNLQKQQYPWDYCSFWMMTDTPNAIFTITIHSLYPTYSTASRSFWCGNNDFNMTLSFNPALLNTWQICSLKFMNFLGYAGGTNWVFVPVQYFTISVDRPCIFWIDNLCWNDGIFFTAPKGLLCWARSEIAPINDELEVTYSFDPFKQEVPLDISFGSAKMAGILLLEYLIGIRQRSTAFTQASDSLAVGPDKETLEFTKARLEREVEDFLSGIGFKTYSGVGAEG